MMWSHKSALLLLVAVCLAAEMDRTIVNLPVTCSSKCKTSCAIARDPEHSQIPSEKTCVIYEDPYDFNLKIGTLSISAHKKVLAASIPYFEDSSASIESKTRDLLENDLNPDAIKMLFRYAYTRKIKINMDNADHILKAARFLDIKNVISICTEFLVSRINTENVIDILNNEESSSKITKIRDAAEHFIQEHFSDVTLTNAFLNLDSEAFLRIMRSNEIRNTSEERIFDAAYNWIAHNQTDRTPLAYQVMENVRFPLIENRYLVHNVTPKILKMRNEPVYQIVYEAMTYQFLPDDRSYMNECNLLPRNVTTNATFVKIVWGSGKIAIQMYDPKNGRLENGEKTPNKHWFTVLQHNCNIFAIGGYNNKSVDVFNLMTKSWRSISPMMEIRRMAGAAVSDSVMFVSGGLNDSTSTVLSSTESINMYESCWKQLAPMAEKRWGHRLVAIGDYVYAVGGYNNVAIKSVEMYSISSNKWSNVAPMLSARREFGAALLYGKLYVCGGVGPGAQLAEVFDPVKKTWTALAKMNSDKSQMSLVSYKNELWAFSKNSNKSEVYDPETDSWTHAPDIFSLDGNLHETVMLNY